MHTFNMYLQSSAFLLLGSLLAILPIFSELMTFSPVQVKSLGEDTAQFESTYDSVTGNFIPSHKGHLQHTKAVGFWPASCKSMFMTSKNHLINYCLLKIILIVNFFIEV